ncbi:MAG: class I SAM-dependent methyltransferase [Actinomycetia bacterium]|nr:class I SAM-dependent methyltransferase [Actinomycetes bacterium]
MTSSSADPTERCDAPGQPPQSAAEHWEEKYASTGQRWSGRVNTTLADLVTGLGPGAGRTAVDLGCGEGGDAVWLAQQGWRVTAVDIAATAVSRTAEAAAAAGVADLVTPVCHDLETWVCDRPADLVTASFLHSEVPLARAEVLRRAARWLAPGGHLVIVSHAFFTVEDLPPWSPHSELPEHCHGLLTPEQEVAALDLDPDGWRVLLAEVRHREASSPDNSQTATTPDGVVLVQRQ